MASATLDYMAKLALLALAAGIPALCAVFDEELVKKVSLSKSTCEFSPYITVPLLFVSYSVRNDNATRLYEANLAYAIKWQNPNGTVEKREGDIEIPSLLPNWTMDSRYQVATLPGERSAYRVTECSVRLTGFYKEVPVTKSKTVTVKTGETLKVAPDCKEDYAKLATLKGLARREYAEKLVRLGCVSTKPVYGKKAESFTEIEWHWVACVK